ncbi:hypothetical protein BLNAU_386 [Blattamonas nauphoetae]|uniref:Uncharacterized protein n=1 Tax=Blattamonas nauphoetae TaxID=2049346 RepID=A0ABQ9YL36_9EUKA|nr:hypothetical protein BLNAU_386 [Blattamonas nauphoetae]
MTSLIDIPITVQYPISSECCSQMLQSAIFNILYLRQQIPDTYESLLKYVNVCIALFFNFLIDQTFERPKTTQERRSIKFVRDATQMADSLKLLFCQSDESGTPYPRRVTCVVLGLGTTPSLLIERYTIFFDQNPILSTTQKDTNENTRRVVFSVLQNISSLPPCSKIHKLFLFAHISSGASLPPHFHLKHFPFFDRNCLRDPRKLLAMSRLTEGLNEEVAQVRLLAYNRRQEREERVRKRKQFVSIVFSLSTAQQSHSEEDSLFSQSGFDVFQQFDSSFQTPTEDDVSDGMVVDETPSNEPPPLVWVQYQHPISGFRV